MQEGLGAINVSLELVEVRGGGAYDYKGDLHKDQG